MLKNSHVKSVGEMTDDDLKFDNCCKEIFFSDHHFFMTLAPILKQVYVDYVPFYVV